MLANKNLIYFLKVLKIKQKIQQEEENNEDPIIDPCDGGNRNLITNRFNTNLSNSSIDFNNKLNSIQSILNNINND